MKFIFTHNHQHVSYTHGFVLECVIINKMKENAEVLKSHSRACVCACVCGSSSRICRTHANVFWYVATNRLRRLPEFLSRVIND